MRKEGEKIIADILEPHTTTLADAVSKAVGLAKYADKHSEFFGRIELIDIAGGRIKRLNVINEATNEKVKRLSTSSELNNLFEEI